MPFLELPTHRLHYRVDGSEGRPWLTFCNSLGTDLHMWDGQIDALAPYYRVLRYDRRGHGASSAVPGPYRVEDLAGDVLALLDALSVERTHFCGLSIGGLTGQWLGLHAGERLQTLTVCATAARIGTEDSWRARIAQVRAEGLAGLLDGTRERWFTPAFAAMQPAAVEAILATFLGTDAQAYLACCEAVAGADFRGALGGIATPLLALAGHDDPVCPPDGLQAIATQAMRGSLAQVHGRHLCNLESPHAFNDALLRFLLQ
ncbi:3-oxoadipate enol-lactonase [Xanthomonas sp. NCPPB 2654]|uniref:3-oxoadipate enol-lactonase n=1 Tax=unclassified Xanthomonas TaxID=2643310 RepID=UPI0021E04DD7|nr:MULTISPECIES: 3-oxoadipate enol-lactonase [unclassified Xanthomonas]MDL5364260.1 3-oxoadipate enol-lactonase [Xanthomonas sp. NCPPB 2654]MDR6674445.1 3-oxoadipate enol-lactonase [Xanthomonas translucens]UYC20442.1 3-oxoadipate enol-lactonase [Xanthomonas sp. CFBP 8443]